MSAPKSNSASRKWGGCIDLIEQVLYSLVLLGFMLIETELGMGD
ncbi:hypothetical protein ACFL6S_35090 [Candidatus Poribacteria bacterium]